MANKLSPSLYRLHDYIVGKAIDFSVEDRLFSFIALFSGLSNIFGIPALIATTKNLENLTGIIIWQGITGVLMLFFYYFARFHNLQKKLYWPFIILLIMFLWINTLAYAGSEGGSHYYFIAAFIISCLLANSFRTVIFSFILFSLAISSIFYFEYGRNELLIFHQSHFERIFDLLGNYIFVMIFSGSISYILLINLQSERKKSDRLLLNILPKFIADELKNNSRVKAMQFKSATVLFTDFVNFTKYTETLSAHELIKMLDEHFRYFDSVCRKYHIEKIKTIGDAYMAVGGIPIINKTHALDCVVAALDICDYIRQITEKQIANKKPVLEIRIGIHTGRLISGIIGQDKFVYDVWGETVNIASRMESSGLPCTVNISKTTYELVKDFFICEMRGYITAKSLGEVEMYTVKTIHPHLAEDICGIKPNATFLKLRQKIEKL